MSDNALESVSAVNQAHMEEVDFRKAVDEAFSTGLASAIMSQFPVACIIAIFKGRKGKKMVSEIDAITEKTGYAGGAKRILAKIFSIYGFISGIVNTATYAFLATYFTVYAIVYFLVLVFMIIAALLGGTAFFAML